MLSQAKRFIEKVEARQLLAPEVVAELRRQVAESKANLPAELLARLLVDNGHLTKYQASRLIAELSDPSADSSGMDDELGFASSHGGVAEAILEDDSDEAESFSNVRSTKSRRTRRTADSPEPFIADDDEDSSERVGVETVHPSPTPILPASRIGVPRLKNAKTNPWDSFRILGVGLLLSLVCVAGFFLVRWLVRGNADDAMNFADNAYQQRSYEDAANAYRNFANNWPAHERASYAKVRTVLAVLRKDVEAASNPLTGLRTAEEQLPTLLGQSALSEQQSDLAGVLAALSEKFIAKIDSTPANDDRKSLMTEMDKLMAMINDPQYVGSTQRTQLAPTLQRVDESRARLRREIARDDELVVALAEMDKQLDAQNVIGAYETRSRLINRHPLLETNPQVIERVHRASAVQRELVVDSSLSIHVESSPRQDQSARTFVLTDRRGDSAVELKDSIFAYQVKDSIFAIQGQSGQVLWRKWVGRSLDAPPIRLSDSSDADFLIAQREIGRLIRVDSRTGQAKWVSAIGEPIHLPAVEGQDIFASTQSGSVIRLDAATGQVKWLKQLPQTTSIGPCVAVDGDWVYQAAGDSTIYVLDRDDGNCKLVAYTGHRDGAIQVAPLLVLEHLILIENINAQSARIRVFEATDDGLQQAQAAIAVDGNVLNPPSVDGRQVLVQSNLGHSLVLDVDPSAPKDKVSIVARVPRNVDSPQVFWPAFQRSQVWLGDKRLARFDLVVTQGQLNRRWIQHEGDEFVGPLQLSDSYLIHARKPRGNQGVKISAATAENGESTWETYLGVPIALLHRTHEGRFDVVASNGSFFALNNQEIRDSANANPGEGKPLKSFSSPVWLSADRAVLLNQANPREFALYSAQDTNPLRILSMSLGTVPSCQPIAADGKLIVPLDNGQLVLFDPANGSLVGGPFQVDALKPGQTVRWRQPVYFSESSTLVAAADVSGKSRLIRLSVGDSLRALQEESLSNPIEGPLARLGDRVAAVQVTSSGDAFTLWDVESLKSTDPQTLTGQWRAGPFSVPNGALLQTSKELVAWDASGTKVWSVPFLDSPLTGSPTISEGNTYLTTVDGTLWVIDSASGLVRGTIDLRQRLSTPPLVRDNRVLVGTDDGVVLLLPIPTEHTLSGRTPN